jgi:exodeoxyribonuclease-5
MLGKELFRYISNSLRGHTKVVFIGDPAQLPPVGEKDQSPAFDMVQRRSQLTEVVRQAQDNPIIALSMEIRSCIEKEEVVTPQIIGSVLPNPKESPKACIAYGGKDTITQWALFELRSGRDCRIIAFTNQTVKRYNAEIHECLFGISECPFSVGEHVIVHEQTEALSVFGRATLHTSEELEILEIEKANHPHWGEIEAYQATLKRDSGQEVKVFFAADQDRLQSLISENFKTWGEYKQQAKTKKLRNEADWPLMDEKAKQYSGRAWGMRKAFANLRHIYAITTHKSQGSTFDTAIVDFNDLKKIRSTFDFNRALYVAITRPRNYLAIVL